MEEQAFTLLKVSTLGAISAFSMYFLWASLMHSIPPKYMVASEMHMLICRSSSVILDERPVETWFSDSGSSETLIPGPNNQDNPLTVEIRSMS